MKRWLRGKNCVYCGIQPATTEDHIFALGFFHHADRDNNPLPKAPACAACNSAKSKLDEYAMALLAFGGRHASALPFVQDYGMKRVMNNRALHKNVRENSKRVMVQQGSGIFQPTFALPVDSGKLTTLFEYVAKGLIWFHRKTYLATGTRIHVLFQTQQRGTQFKAQFAVWNWRKVNAELRNRTIMYEGIWADAMPQFSAWRLSILGGIHLSNTDPKFGVCDTIGIITDQEGQSVSEAKNNLIQAF